MLNKTPKESAKKTKSAHSYTFYLAGCVAVLVIGFLLVKPNSCSGLTIGSRCIALERADTEAERVQGLSDRDRLDANTGMLFVFEGMSRECFWMKDMRFSIDMIWLDADRRVIEIKENANPDSYPERYCADGTQYVIELPAGDAQKLGISIGQQLHF